MKTISIKHTQSMVFRGYFTCNKIYEVLVDNEFYIKLLLTDQLPETYGMAAYCLEELDNEKCILANNKFFMSLSEEDVLRILSHEIGHLEMGHVDERMLGAFSEDRTIQVELEADEYAVRNFKLSPTKELYIRTFEPALAWLSQIDESLVEVAKKQLAVRLANLERVLFIINQ